MQFGELIKQRRKTLGLTQKQLAERMGVSFQVISKWEQSATLDNIQVSTLRKISNALRLDIEEFLYFETVVYIIMLALYYACNDIEINLLVRNFLNSDLTISQLSKDDCEYIQSEMQYTSSNLGANLLALYKSIDYEEKIFNDMLLRMFEYNKTIQQAVCKQLQAYTLQHSIEQILINSDKTAQNEYLVKLIINNCKPNKSNQGYTMPINLVLDYTSADSMEFLTDTNNNINDSSKFVINSILHAVKNLNSLGQQKAIEQIELLAKIPEYQADKTKDSE
jgi:transcriptional regulator with XRE-family HTH domain